MEKCCDACGDGEYYFRSVCLASQGARIPVASNAVDYGNRWDIRWVSGRGKTPTFCVFPVFSVAVMEKCCDAYGDGDYYLQSGSLASDCVDVQQATNDVGRKSMGHTVAERSWEDADFLCISCI
jgi:hypothetical protein